MTKATATPVKKTAAAAPKADTTNDSSLPVWKGSNGRVQGAIWRHLQDDGKARFTISISRSYKDDNNKWQNVHYFDERDLKDIHATCVEAEEQILALKDMSQAVGED